jgi:hypothetical protein
LSYMPRRERVSAMHHGIFSGFHWRGQITRNKAFWSHVFEWPDLIWHIPHDVPTLLVTRRPYHFRKYPRNGVALQDVHGAIQCCVIKRTDNNVFSYLYTYFDNKLRTN